MEVSRRPEEILNRVARPAPHGIVSGHSVCISPRSAVDSSRSCSASSTAVCVGAYNEKSPHAGAGETKLAADGRAIRHGNLHV